MSSTIDTIRELNGRAWAICKKDGPRAIQLAREAQQLLAGCSETTPLDEFECLKTQTYCLDMLSKPDEALPIGLRANRLAEQIGDPYLIGSIQSILGRIYWHIDDYPTAMDVYLSALALVQTGTHPALEVSLTNGLGLVQYGLGNYAGALEYFETCLEKSVDGDLTGRADASNNIAYTLHMLGRDQEGLGYGLAALDLFRTLGTAVGRMETLHSLGAIHFALGNYDEAMTALQEGVELSREANCQLLEISYTVEISCIHRLWGNRDEAEEELLRALQIAEGLDSLTNISRIHERLVEIYKEKQDLRSALAHFEAFHAAYKRTFNDESDRRIRNLEIRSQVESARRQADLYRELAGSDSLTGLVNRRHFVEIAGDALQQAKDDGGQLAIVMLDVDYFKGVNDLHGHTVGDRVLTAVAAAIRESLRAGDVAGRYGGEEFVVLVVGLSPKQCVNLAERIRHAVAQQAIQIGKAMVRVTISLGVAWTRSGGEWSLDGLIDSADQALYVAKQRGRNRVVAWAPDAQFAGIRQVGPLA